jgi:hypothetical protein
MWKAPLYIVLAFATLHLAVTGVTGRYWARFISIDKAEDPKAFWSMYVWEICLFIAILAFTIFSSI